MFDLKMDQCGECNHSHCKSSNASVSQTLSEMDWERGLWHAAFYGDEKRVKELINKTRNAEVLVNTGDNAGYTPLHYAARKGNVDICKMLLQYGARIDSQTKSGLATPLHKAAAAGTMDTLKFLIQSGAQVEMQDVDGQTVLHKALENKHTNMINYLLATYPELAHVRDVKGQSAADFMPSQSE